MQRRRQGVRTRRRSTFASTTTTSGPRTTPTTRRPPSWRRGLRAASPLGRSGEKDAIRCTARTSPGCSTAPPTGRPSVPAVLVGDRPERSWSELAEAVARRAGRAARAPRRRPRRRGRVLRLQPPRLPRGAVLDLARGRRRGPDLQPPAPARGGRHRRPRPRQALLLDRRRRRGSAGRGRAAGPRLRRGRGRGAAGGRAGGGRARGSRPTTPGPSSPRARPASRRAPASATTTCSRCRPPTSPTRRRSTPADSMIHVAAFSHASGPDGAALPLPRRRPGAAALRRLRRRGALRPRRFPASAPASSCRRRCCAGSPRTRGRVRRRDGIGTILAGAAPILPADLRDAVGALGPVVWNGYGQGESPLHDHRQRQGGDRRRGSRPATRTACARSASPASGVVVRVARPRTGRSCRPARWGRWSSTARP